MKRKSGVTKKTWSKNATKFATSCSSAWKDLNACVNSHCKRKSANEKEMFMDALCEIVDRYVNLNCEILRWCHKNGVNPNDFFCDVINHGIV